jgi:hypothetical protein
MTVCQFWRNSFSRLFRCIAISAWTLFGAELGLTQMATASLGFGTLREGVPATVGDVNRVTDLFNTFAAKAHDAGMVAVLHNEGL